MEYWCLEIKPWHAMKFNTYNLYETAFLVVWNMSTLPLWNIHPTSKLDVIISSPTVFEIKFSTWQYTYYHGNIHKTFSQPWCMYAYTNCRIMDYIGRTACIWYLALIPQHFVRLHHNYLNMVYTMYILQLKWHAEDTTSLADTTTAMEVHSSRCSQLL